jgi:hypothetical protein
MRCFTTFTLCGYPDVFVVIMFLHFLFEKLCLLLRILVTPVVANHTSTILKAKDPFKMAPASMSNTYKTIHNIHMMWMCMWICDRYTSTVLFFQAFANSSRAHCFIPRGKPYHSAIVETKDPFKMAHTPMAVMFKMFHNIHMMWMFRWVCLYHVSASLV